MKKISTRATGNFYRRVIMRDRRFNSATRIASLDLLHPVFRRKVEAIITDLARHGHTAFAYETYRSEARQLELYRTGATELKTVGVHHYGLAADIVFLDVNGNPSWSGDYALVGKLAGVHHVIWGGDWGRPGVRHPFVDQPHCQWIRVEEQNALFDGSWYPADDYDPHSPS